MCGCEGGSGDGTTADILTCMEDSPDIPPSTPMDAWLDALGQPQGSPGGGAASGVMLGLGASLLSMVAGYTPDDSRAAECAARVAALRGDALQAVEADGIVSARFGEALALPSDDEDREPRVRDAAVEAAESTAALGRIGLSFIPEARLLAEVGNRHLDMDLAVGLEALEAGLSGVSLTLRANLQIARTHEAPSSRLADLIALVGELAGARRIVGEIIAELSSHLD